MRTTLKRKIWRWRGVWVTVPCIAGGLLILQLAGALQFMELAALDQMFRLRPAEPVDSRIVLVTIDESDIKQLGQWPMSDAVLARLLSALKQQQPRVIGLDIFRNLPVEPGHPELTDIFTSTPHLIGIEKVIKTAQGEVVQAPPLLKQRNQVSASDLLLDPDNRIRRSLLFLRTSDNRSIFTLGARLAFFYLDAQGVKRHPLNADQTHFQLGRAIFTPLKSNDGGYVDVDARGYQILSNFPKFQHGFHSISITDVLQGRIPQDLFRDRIVFVGLTAESLEDSFFTSYTTDVIEAPAGVEVHALLASQLLSGALDGRPLLNVGSELIEWLWIIIWSAIGAKIGWRSRSPQRTALQMLLFSVALLGIVYVLFLIGWWLIIVAPMFALVGSAIMSSGYLWWENLKDYAHILEQKVEERTLKLQQEIADRKQVEFALAESEARFRQLAGATVEAIIITEENTVIDTNEAFTQMFGYPVSEIIGMSMSHLIFQNSRRNIASDTQAYSESLDEIEFDEVICLRSDQTTFPAEIHAKVTTYGERVVRIASIRDISDRKRAEEASILEERNRMAREIHDTLAQSFTSIIVHLDAAAQRLTFDPDAAQAHLKTGRTLARSGLADARRSVEALRPQILEEGDLQSALERFVAQVFDLTTVQVICEAIGEPYALSREVETNLLRIGQEALTNAFKYANASEICVELRYERSSLGHSAARSQCILQIKDNGQGFKSSSLLIGRGFGLLGMTERAERIGAKLSIKSHPGEGTTIVVSVQTS